MGAPPVSSVPHLVFCICTFRCHFSVKLFESMPQSSYSVVEGSQSH